MKLFSSLFFTVLMGLIPASAFALPNIPGCPLHDSCVRAFKQEQRERQRQQRQKESPDALGDEEENDEPGTVKKPLGLILGFQIDLGDFNDKKNNYINLRPSLAYLNSFGNMDVFASVFYTIGMGENLPTRSRGGFDTNVGYTFDLSERFTLTPEIDNQIQLDFNPDANSLYSNGKILSYAVLEPLLRVGCELEFGDISLANSFPFAYADDLALDYTVSMSFNALIGLGVTLSSRFWNLGADFQYGETELMMNFWRGAFFASLILTADSAFRQFSVEPYLSYRIKRASLFAGVLFANLGMAGTNDEIRLNRIQGRRDVSSVIPSLGAKFRF
jgi:hypothetical protein